MLSFPSAHPAPYKSGKIELKEQVGALRRLPHSGDVKRGTWNVERAGGRPAAEAPQCADSGKQL